MAKCKNEVLLSKISLEKVNKTTEVDFTVLDDLADCKKIMANAYVEASPENPAFNAYKRPTNRYECDSHGCLSGTLTLAPQGEGEEATPGSATYKAQFDATEFAAGVVTFYVAPTEDGEVTFTIGSDVAMTDANVYKVPVKATDAGDDGFIPVTIDLSKVPDSEQGEGWAPSASGAYIKIESSVAAGISSISIFDSMEDFEINDVVKVGCLSEISGDESIDAAEATCVSGGYDTTSPSFERTITGKTVTPNYWKLNPLLGKGEATDGFVSTTISRVITADGDYGKITLADMADECGFLTISIADSCDVTSAHLERLSIPSKVDVDGGHYIVVPGEDGATDILFNADLVGTEVIVSYPKKAKVRERVADLENVGNRRVKMAVKHQQSDGVEVVRVYGNVLITSFPMTISEDETEFSFTVNIQQDSDGHYYREWVIEA